MQDRIDALEPPTYEEQLALSEQAFMANCQRLYDGKEQAFALRQDVIHIPLDDGSSVAPTYHNWDHITAAYTSTDDILADFSQGKDIFNLAQQVERYKESLGVDYIENQEMWDRFFGGPEFALTWRLMWAGHDLGNLTDSHEFDEDGSVPYHADYLIKGAEARSQDLTDQLIEKHFGSHEMKDIMKKFSRHLIEQTIYIPDEEPDVVLRKAAIPFHNFVQFIDQVGSGFYNRNNYALIVSGLLNEFRASNEQGPLSQTPHDFAFFPFMRGVTLYGRQESDNFGLETTTFLEIMDYFKAKKPEKYDEIERLYGRVPEDLRTIDYDRDVSFFAGFALGAHK